MERSISSRAESRARPARMWWLVMLLGAVVIVTAALVAITRTGLFRVRAVEIEGASHLSRAEVIGLAAIDRHANALWLDEQAAERGLERDPWVLRADVQVTLPSTVHVRIDERVPVAAAPQRTGFLMVAGDGTVLGAATRAAGLPILILPSIPRWEGPTPSIEGPARALGSLATDLRARVRRVLASGDALSMVLDGGMRVSYGAPEGFAAKARALEEILKWASTAEGSLRSVTVTAPSAPAVVFTP